MGFISFNEKYYVQKLEKFENKVLTYEEVYEVKQLLKVLDDLTDEGYTNLSEQMEKDFSCISRLRTLISKANTSPFLVDHQSLPQTTYQEKELELGSLLDRLLLDVNQQNTVSDNVFLQNIHEYCEWIGNEEDTAYIFLLRDSLLPYLYYRSKCCKNVYPWLLSRRFLQDITKTDFVDDSIRLSIYDALENKLTKFEDFKWYCKKKILSVLDKYGELKQILLALLASIEDKKIVVVESGYSGTFPMMLSALDDRVTFKMYTTAPFLYETYREHIFCQRYEDIRRFETLCSQDILLRYSSYHDGKFYVQMTQDMNIKELALAEIKYLSS